MRKNNLLKKTAWIVLSAVLFGTVAGTVMTGIQIASSGMVSQFFAIVASDEDTVKAEGEALPPPEPFPGEKIPETFPQAADIPAPSTDVSEIVEEAMPTVVAVASTAVYQTPDYGYSWFFGGGSQSYEVPSSGSGIIIGKNDTELLIVTNNHVVKDTVSLKITFVDDTAVDAAVKGTDADTDLAVISIPIDQIPQETQDKIAVARLGDSDSLKVGQGVIAIGNALGYGQSVTVGYVSALNREVQTSDGNTRVLLQTDAAINPGNSGGALVNASGEVIGINSSKLVGDSVEGVGYAIPISDVSDLIENLMNQETKTKVAEADQGAIGIKGMSVSTEYSQQLNMPEGVYVSEVTKGGGAEKAGMTRGCIITGINGTTVSSKDDLQEQLQYYAKGDEVELTIQVPQSNGEYQEQSVTVILGAKQTSK